MQPLFVIVTSKIKEHSTANSRSSLLESSMRYSTPSLKFSRSLLELPSLQLTQQSKEPAALY